MDAVVKCGFLLGTLYSYGLFVYIPHLHSSSFCSYSFSRIGIMNMWVVRQINIGCGWIL